MPATLIAVLPLVLGGVVLLSLATVTRFTIPGWSVKDKACISPRIVNATGVSDAVLERGRQTPDVLTKSEIRKIGDQIEHLCRSAA